MTALHHATAAPRVAFYFAAMFSVNGAALPYLNVWLADVGLTLGEIATIAAVTPLVRMIAGPFASLSADMTRAHRALLIGCGWVWFAAWLLQSASGTFRAALGAQVLIAVASAGIGPLIEATAVSCVRNFGMDYGRVRVWGSITFIVASIAGGWLVDWRGIGAIIWYLVAGAFVTALAGHLLPRFGDGMTAGRRIGWTETLALVRAPEFLLFLLAAGLVQSAHATLYVFSVIHWKALGLSNGWCGALWAVSVMVEIGIFIWGSTYLKGFSLVLLLAGAVAATLRWTLMAFDPPLALLIALQTLHGLTFGASHLGAIQFLTRAVPEAQGGTAQGLYALVTSGLFMAVSAAVAGAFYTRYGGLAYLPMAALSAGGVTAFWLLHRRWRGQTIAV